MHNKTIKELYNLIYYKKISVTELTIFFLKRIKKNNLNAFLDINEDFSINQAKNIDNIYFKNKNKNKIFGIPIAHKDIFVTNTFKTTAGSKFLKNFISPFDATIIKLLKKDGMINLGKLNCDEFSMGSSNENSYFGNVKNPWDLDFIPGGSSGGPAAAVAARLIPAATATDTGGSIRQPSSFCGVTGIKPTYGSISRFGMISFSSSLDQAGVITKTAEDCGLILNSIIKFDPKDSTSIKRPNENYNKYLNKSIKNLKIGLPIEFFNKNISKHIKNSIYNVLLKYVKLGVKFVNISLPNIKYSTQAYQIISSVEASSNLSRFDGIRYGFKKNNYNNINKLYKNNRSDNFGKEVKKRILLGSWFLLKKNYNKFYVKAQKVRKLISEDFKKIFYLNKCDAIIAPTSHSLTWKLGKNNKDINYLSDIFNVSVNLAGLPSISVPCGFFKNKNKKNLPIGFQLIGNYFKESILLNLTHQFQKITSWHLKTPLKNKL